MKRKIIAIGASAGGLETICAILQALPKNFPAIILIVLHTSDRPHKLKEVFGRCTELTVHNAAEGTTIKKGNVYISSPSHHLLIKKNKIQLSFGPKINKFRPSIDLLFESIAKEHGSEAIGILLSGLLYDGAVGLGSIKRMGGITIVQDPNDAPYPNLPSYALQHSEYDYCLPVAEIGPLIKELIKQPIKKRDTKKKLPPSVLIDLVSVEGKQTTDTMLNKIGKPSIFTCPECHGTLWEILDDLGEHYRCRTGHGFNLGSLFNSQMNSLENILWSAVKALEETATLSGKIAQSLEKTNILKGAVFYRNKTKLANQQANELRQMITDSAISQLREKKQKED